MTPQRIISLSARLVRIVAYVFVAGVVAFFALTRTEIGREGLRNELERRFNQSLDGRLQIGYLSGNLLNRLSARDVVVRDQAGRTVIRIDSVVLHPTWRDVLRRTVSARRATLIRPVLSLSQDEPGRWNIADVFEADFGRGRSGPWSFHSARIDIVEGRVRTQSSTRPPSAVRAGTVFDWTNAEAADVDGRIIVDWQQDLKLLDVLELNARLTNPGVDVDSLRGQLVLDSSGLAIHEMHLRTPGSSIHVGGSVSSLDALSGSPSSAAVNLDLERSTIDGAEMRRIFPAFPLRESVRATVRLGGPLDRLDVEDLTLERDSSFISFEGIVVGLPDSAAYEAAVRSSTLRWRDVADVVPDVGLDVIRRLDPVSVAGQSEGTVTFGGADRPASWIGSHEFRIESAAGRMEGEAMLSVRRHHGAPGAANFASAGSPPGGATTGPRTAGHAALRVEGSVDFASLDAGLLLNRPGLSSNLTGRITIQAGGATLREASGQAAVALSSSSWVSRRIDTLSLDLAGDVSTFQARLFAAERAAEVEAVMAVDVSSAVPHVRIDGRTSRLDVGSLAGSRSISSSLNTRFLLDGSGASWPAFEGTLDLDVEASTVTDDSTTHYVAPHSSHLTILQNGAGEPQLSLSGDVAELDVSGDVALRPLTQLARHWVHAFRRSAARELNKPYRLSADASDERFRVAALLPSAASVETSAPVDGIEPVRVDIRARILQSEILSALLPGLPTLQTDVRAEGDLLLAPNAIDVRLRVLADSLHVGRVRSRGVDVSLSAAAESADSVTRSLAADLSAAAEQLEAGRQRLDGTTLTGSFHERGLDVTVRAGAPGAASPLRLRARMDLLEDRNRLVVDSLQAAAGARIWRTSGVSVVDFFKEAVVVRGIRVERADADSTAGEYVHVEGTLSSAPQDTLFVRAEHILVRHVGDMLGLQSDLDGQLAGRLAFTGLNRRPELTGDIAIEPMIYRDRLLGRLFVSSRYVPGSPDVALLARLRPMTPTDSTLLPADNDLEVNGTFRLPTLERSTQFRDAGALDLDARIRRADAFFFEHIFTEVVADVDGSLRGSAHIGGDFSAPIFEADLFLEQTQFRIPDFQLSYEAGGPVTVDQEGIHLRDVSVTDPDDGAAVVHGSVLFNDYQFFSFDLHGALEEFRIMNVPQSRELPFYGRIMASGDVSLTGPLSNASLVSSNARTSPESDLFIPISETGLSTDAGFIVFADSTGQIPDIRRLTRRRNLLADRPAGERPFLEGLDMDLNVAAPDGSTVHLVIDPLLGDVINAVGSGRVQLVRDEGEFSTFGTFTVSSGDYLFTAGEVFYRRFLIDSGTIGWDGDPLNASLDISASYRTRASTEGLELPGQDRNLIPLVIELGVSGRVSAPIVDLSLSIDRDNRTLIGGYEGLEAFLNQPEQAAQYATSVLLTNSFMLTADQSIAQSRGQLAFNSLSQLVASQLNRYLNYALPNVNLNLGVQGESAEDLDVTYGVALRLLDERLIIRGQGIYQNDQLRRQQEAVLDEFVVEVRLNPRVSVEVFYRREGDLLGTESLNTSTTGAGLSYQTEFSTWRRLLDRIFGWLYLDEEEEDPDDVVAGADDE